MKARTFIDSVVLYAASGHGGNGCVGFRREKFVPHGGPDGGDGGCGGDVVIRADAEVDSLVKYYYTPHQRAAHGGAGRGRRLHGKNGDPLILKVPCGTELHEKETGRLLGEVLQPGDEIIVGRGGHGGKGNWHWRSPTHQAPTEHSDGEPGEEIALRLELKIVSDIGLIGFPNAGKSSLLTAISDAHPKVGAYPFTTLNPIIGTLIFEDYTRARVADIPGIIAGAHEGVGLGDAFLRHVERAPCLVFVIDMAGVDNRQPHEDLPCLREELRLYNETLTTRPFLVAANKMDLPEAMENLETFRRETGEAPIPISAETGDGIPQLKQAIEAMWKKHNTGAR